MTGTLNPACGFAVSASLAARSSNCISARTIASATAAIPTAPSGPPALTGHHTDTTWHPRRPAP